MQKTSNIGIPIEVEDKEIALQNEKGSIVIIPKNKVSWVKDRIKKGCHSCIDELVSTLPTLGNYAMNGMYIPPNNGKDPVVKLVSNMGYNNIDPITPIDPISPLPDPDWGVIGEEVTIVGKAIPKPRFPKKRALQEIQSTIDAQNPQGVMARGEWLNSLSEEDEFLVKRQDENKSINFERLKKNMETLMKRSAFSTVNEILGSSEYSNREKKELLRDYKDHPIMNKFKPLLEDLAAKTRSNNEIEINSKTNHQKFVTTTQQKINT